MKPLLKLKTISMLLFTSSLNIFSQTSITSPGKYYLFKNYSTQNGLLNNSIYSMTQDKHGAIWVGTFSGLSRFDGKTFYHKSIPQIYDNSAYVQHLITMPNGNIIATGVMQGAFVQQDDGQFKQFLEKGYIELGKNIFQTIKYCPDNSILAGYTHALFLIEGDSIKKIFDQGFNNGLITTLDIDKDNRIWFGGRLGLGILQQNDTEYAPVFFPELKDKYVFKILFDDDGTLHIGTSQGYYRIKWHQKSDWNNNYSIEQPFDPLKEIGIHNIYIDKEKNLWILTNAYGVFRTKGDSITLHVTKENGLASSTIQCMLQDSEGNYWFGTSLGVSMVKDFDNYAVAKDGARYKDTRSLKKDEFNRIWIYSESATLHIYQNEELIPVSLKDTPMEEAGIQLLNIQDSEMLISNSLGLFKLPITESMPDLRKMEKIIDYKANNISHVRALSKESSGIWLYAQLKIYNFYNNKLSPVKFNHADSISIRPSLLLKDKYGYFWCGDQNFGLYRGIISHTDKNNLLFDSLTIYKSLKPDSAFVTTWIQDMTLDKEGNLWFSTLYTGVYKLVLDNNGVVSYKLYSTENGLLSNYVQRINFDDDGKLWLMTDKGINIISYDSTGTEIIDKLDVNEGVDGRGIWCMQMDDKMYILTFEGLYITQNQLFKEKSKKMPKVSITNILINGASDLKISANSNNFSLANTQKNITIEYSAITFTNAEDIRYQYKLEGADNDWSLLSERGFVEYAALRPGRYTFKVRTAMIGNENETSEETSLSFRIRPAYYQTIWFYSLIAIAIFSLLYAFFKYRLRQVIKMERMRTRIASDLHDDIGSTLSSISLIIEMASQHAQESALAKALSKIGTDSKVVLSSMDDIIWSVNPKNDSLSNLLVRLREYAIPLCESKNITFNIKADDTIHSIKLEMDQRRNLFLIVKESINNAVKHSSCKNLTVEFIKTHELEILIQDDGCGFDPTSPSSRNGIVNIKRRAEQIGSELFINSELEKGTSIRLKIRIV